MDSHYLLICKYLDDSLAAQTVFLISGTITIFDMSNYLSMDYHWKASDSGNVYKICDPIVKKMTLHTLFDLLCYVSGEQLNEWLSSELEFIVGMNQMYYRNSYIFLIGKSE